MAQVIINVFLGFIRFLVIDLFSPVWTLLNTFLESLGFTTYITIFNNVLSNYVVPGIGFFCDLLPPRTMDLIAFELAFLIGFYVISWTWDQIIHVLKLVKLIPFA